MTVQGRERTRTGEAATADTGSNRRMSQPALDLAVLFPAKLLNQT